ncbi:unnamed protein product [Durusdinium trenchii]|uniref:Exostosin GT47 domain-containing protein n=1 Tax=Durusdinium trenchii TaxID=1381693 RepID=A0ABP0K8Z7_9DINO
MWRYVSLIAGNAAFFVPLDSNSIKALFGRFALLEPPSAICPGEDDDSWHPFCAFGLSEVIECQYNGYQYSMEWYFLEMLRNNRQYRSEDLEDAEFIYFPHCVSQLYFALRQRFNFTHWQAIERAELGYLVPILRWAHRSPAHQRHHGRNFWTVFSMDLGRQDFPRSAAWLEPWSVGSLTGSATWMRDNDMFFKTHSDSLSSARKDADGSDCWDLDTAPVALANTMFPARNFRVQDTVISIPSRFSPHPRSRRFGGRPVLAYFAGSPNSCARERIVKVLSGEPGFDVSTSFAKSNDDYRERMWRARFCFVLRGSSHTNNVRLYDVIAHGCVPIIVSDDFQPPLDRLLPWKDMAIFLPTSSIPRLVHLLRHEITEEDRWRCFRNIALGSPQGEKGFPEDLEAAKHMASKFALDRDTLWSGLSAGRVFEWHDSHFWILFYADVANKLRDRVKQAVEKAVHPAPLRVKTLEQPEGSPTPRGSFLALQWLLDLHHRREKRSPQVVRCGSDSFFSQGRSSPSLKPLEEFDVGGGFNLAVTNRHSCKSEPTKFQNAVLQVSSDCEMSIWELLKKNSPQILWIDNTTAELRKDLAFVGWLCFSQATLQPLFHPFELEGLKPVICGQERDGDLEKLLKLGSSQSSERWGAQFTFWHHQENTRGRFLYT